MKIKPELLAPAGSFESMQAAIHAGADAIYLGGRLFSARAYATNFDHEKLLEAIDYCHLYNRKIYLTLNTLVKPREINDLYDFLRPLYERGLDAVIVQDIGVMHYLREHFKGLPVHASTQMNIHNLKGIQLLEQLDVKRVVLSREVSLEEIQHILENTTMEIETFVHGALCYCYSGQCLMSSILGGRSGNRGRCAQPCRLPYRLYNNEQALTALKGNYLLSPKDISALELMPVLLALGIHSFKIEGRMKRPEYVAGVTSIYRRHIDHYLATGNDLENKVLENDRKVLQDLYNRGGFSKGYYLGKNNEDMMATEKPNHWGRAVGRVTEVKGSQVMITCDEALYKGDVLHLESEGLAVETGGFITLKTDYSVGDRLSLPAKGKKSLLNGLVYRTKSPKLLETIQQEIIDQVPKLRIMGTLVCKKNINLELKIRYKDHTVDIEGPMVEPAKRQPMTLEKLKEQLNKTGNTPYEFDNLVVDMDPDVFVPVSVINQLRRDGLDGLTKALLREFRREDLGCQVPKVNSTELRSLSKGNSRSLNVSFLDMEKAKIALSYKEVEGVYISCGYETLEDFIDYVHQAIEAGKKVYWMMPPILRGSETQSFEAALDILENSPVTGYVIKTYGQFQSVQKSAKEKIIDYNLYVMNEEAIKAWLPFNPSKFSLPLELNYKEIKQLPTSVFEIWGYGYIPLMVTEQCVVKSADKCKKGNSTYFLEDRYNKKFPIEIDCANCRNNLYNSSPTSLLDQMDKIRQLDNPSLRLHFTFESLERIQEIMDVFIESYYYNKNTSLKMNDFNRGHFLRGVE